MAEYVATDKSGVVYPPSYIDALPLLGTKQKLAHKCWTAKGYPLEVGTKGRIMQIVTSDGLTWLAFVTTLGFATWISPNDIKIGAARRGTDLTSGKKTGWLYRLRSRR